MSIGGYRWTKDANDADLRESFAALRKEHTEMRNRVEGYAIKAQELASVVAQLKQENAAMEITRGNIDDIALQMAQKINDYFAMGFKGVSQRTSHMQIFIRENLRILITGKTKNHNLVCWDREKNRMMYPE